MVGKLKVSNRKHFAFEREGVASYPRIIMALVMIMILED